MPAQTLGDALVAELTCPPQRAHFEVFDTRIRGLYVDVLANGRQAFRVRYYRDGKKRSLTLGDARLLTVAEAREQARAVLRKVLVGGDPRAEDIPEDGPTVATFYRERYLPYVMSYKRSWQTDETVLRHHILPALGERAMGRLSAPDIAPLVAAMRRRGYAPGSINRVLVLLRHGYSLAMRWRIDGITTNPARELKNLKEDNRLERYLTAAQTEHLLRAVRHSPNPLLGPIVAFLLFTGARKREVLDARWTDIDWSQRRWRIPRTKAGKVRHVPLSTGALAVLEALHDNAVTETAPIFANPRTGRPFVSVFHSWNTARRQAGLSALRMHDLRHSFASFLVNAGRSLYEVQELLGHADIRTTSRYAHLSQERLRDAVEVVPIGR